MNDTNEPVKPAILDHCERLASDTAEVIAFLTERAESLAGWAPSSRGIDIDLLQLFPQDDRGDNSASALIVANALGGQWTPSAPNERFTRENWDGVITLPSGRVMNAALHYVGPWPQIEAAAMEGGAK